ncbi:hypothetical protein HDU76_006007 [Blyttiomyces sp. JEL0837]|nr:hypothetical protein HDU76_006007 [Blyttiomyces sp. JEL0837]
MFSRVATFPPQPATIRGHPVHLGADPKGENFLYTNGRSVIIRNLDNPAIAKEYNGHSTAATVARFSPSGFYVASGDASGNIRIWDATQSENILKTETRALSGRVNDLVWDFESKRLIAVGDGKDKFGHAFLFDTASSVGEISGHSKTINAVSINSGRPFRAVTCSDDMTVNFYHGVPFKFNKSIRDHTRFVQCVRFSPNGDHFVTAGLDSKVRHIDQIMFLYDGKTGDKVAELTGVDQSHTGGIFSVAWSPDGSQIMSASSDSTVKLWDVNAKKVVNTYTLGDGSIEGQQVGSLWAGKHMLSVSLGGEISFLEQTSTKPTRVVRGHQRAITALAADRAEKTFYSGSYDGRVYSWGEGAIGGSPVGGSGHTNQILSMNVADKKIYSIGLDDSIRSIDVTSKTFTPFVMGTQGVPTSLAVKGDRVLVTSSGTITLLENDSTIATVPVKWAPTAAAFSPDGKTIAVGDEERNVHIFSVNGSALSEGKVLQSNRGLITELAFSPDGTMLASACKERSIIVFSTADWSVKITQWMFHSARVNCLAWSPDSKHAASGSLDTNVEIWSVEKPTKHVCIKGAHLDGVNCVQFMDNETVVSAGQDASIKMWKFTPQ